MDAARVLDILALGRAFIEAGHLKGSSAANREGLPRDWQSADAFRFCAVGAYRRARFELDDSLPADECASERDPLDSALWNLLATASGHPRYDGTELPSWNDDPDTTTDMVLAAYDRAAAAIGKR